MDPKKISDRIQTQVNGYLSDFAGQSEPHQKVLSGPKADSPVLHGIMGKIEKGECSLHDLGRGYKHTPHAPPGVLFKYLVHRINHVDDYEAPNKGHQLDHEFMKQVRSGGAIHQNHLVTPRHLNSWMLLNPHLVEQALTERQLLGSKIREAGVNFRTVNGEPYVAMTRGLDTEAMGPEMSLASFSDLRDSGFGKIQHHVWMPVRDLWYAFPYSPELTWGNHGHENEWLFSNSGARYAASAKDITESVFANNWKHIVTPLGVVSVGGAPLDPALTAEDLKTVTDLDYNFIYQVATHPNFNESVSQHLINLASINPSLLPIISMAKEPSLALHKHLIEALDRGPEEAPFLPAKMVGLCFQANKAVDSPQAFNNSKNTERYLRAVADYFNRFGDDAELPYGVYHMILTSGRCDDTLVSVLADIGKTGKNLPGTNHTDHASLMSEMARFNQHLTPRQLLILSTVPACAEGLLCRPTPLASGVQENIAKEAEGDELVQLSRRRDLSPAAAEILLNKFKHIGNCELGVFSIAVNPRIPVSVVEKHINESTAAGFAKAIATGIDVRQNQGNEDIVKPFPAAGGIS